MQLGLIMRQFGEKQALINIKTISIILVISIVTSTMFAINLQSTINNNERQILLQNSHTKSKNLFKPIELWNFTFDGYVNDFDIARNGVNVSVVVENSNGEMLYFTNYGSSYLYPYTMKDLKAVALSSNGRWMSVDGWDGTVYLYDNSHPDIPPKFFNPPYPYPPKYDVDLIGGSCQAVITGGYYGVFDGSGLVYYGTLSGGSSVALVDTANGNDAWENTYVMFATEEQLRVTKNIQLYPYYTTILDLSYSNLKDADLSENSAFLAVTDPTELIIYKIDSGSSSPYWTYTYPSGISGESVSISDNGNYAIVLYNESGTYGTMLFDIVNKQLIWTSNNFAGVYLDGSGNFIGGFTNGHPGIADINGNVLWYDSNITVNTPSKSILKMNNEGILIVKDAPNKITAVTGEQYTVSVRIPDAMVVRGNYTIQWKISGGTAPYKVDLFFMGTHRPFLIFNNTTIENASFWYNSYFFYWINRWNHSSYQEIISYKHTENYSFVLPPPPPGIPPYFPAWPPPPPPWNWTTYYDYRYPAWTWGQIPPPPYLGKLPDWYILIRVKDASGHYAYGRSNIVKIGNSTGHLKMYVNIDNTTVHSGDYLRIDIHVENNSQPAANVIVFPIFPTPVLANVFPSNFSCSLYYSIFWDGKQGWPRTDSNGNVTLWYNLPIVSSVTEKTIFLVAVKIPDNNSQWPDGTYNITKIKILPPDTSKPYRALIFDPLKNPIIFSALQKMGKNYNSFWERLRDNYHDLEITRIDPWTFSKDVNKYIVESPKSLEEAINVTHANVIVLSDNLFKIWEANYLSEYSTLEKFIYSNDSLSGGLVITHGSINDIGIPINDVLIGTSHYVGLYKNSSSNKYEVDFNNTLSFLTGLGLMPFYEKIKIITGTIASQIIYEALVSSTGDVELSKTISKTVGSVINNTPLMMPFVPFNKTIKVLNTSSPILQGIPLYNNTFNLNITSPIPHNYTNMPYTVIGWQLEYPELIALQALNLLEDVINLTSNNTKSYFEFILNETSNTSLSRYLRSLNISFFNSLFNNENLTNLNKIIINSLELSKKILYGIYRARVNLPKIKVYVPPFKVYYPNMTGNNNWTLENITLGNFTLNITLPSEIAKFVCKFIKPPEIIATSVDYKAAILAYEGIYHRSVWFTFKPESTLNYVNLRLIYNAIKYASVKLTPPPTIRDLIVDSMTKAAYDNFRNTYNGYNASLLSNSSFVAMNGSAESHFVVPSNTQSIIIAIVHPTYYENIRISAESPSGIIYYSYHYNTSIEFIRIDYPEIGLWTINVTYNSTLNHNTSFHVNYEPVVIEVFSKENALPEFSHLYFIYMIIILLLSSTVRKHIRYLKNK